MSSISSQVEPFKLRSRRCRNRALEALARGDAELAEAQFGTAVEAMGRAIEFLANLGIPDPESARPASEAEIELATQLADCWGMLGGVHRAAGLRERAIAAYDEGFRFEGSPRFAILSTYNRVNRLVVRILVTPGLLDEPAPPVQLPDGRAVTMPELLEEVRDEISCQLRAGRRDRPWALADLVLVSVLGGLEGVTTALRGLGESSANDPFPFQSTLKVVWELAALDLPCRAGLIWLGEHLRRKLQSMPGEPVAPGPRLEG